MTAFRYLFTPVTIGKLQLKNRIIVPPSIQMEAWDDMFIEHVKNMFVRRARAGVGLIMLTSLKVANLVDTSTVHPGICDDCFIPALKRITEAVHATGVPIG